jgi:sulfite exporter TauE/SafE
LLFGLLGKGLSIFGLQQKLSILIGVVMVGVILLPFGKLKKYNLAKPLYQLIAKVKSLLGKELSKRTADTFLTIGFLNGFLPCGLVYMAVLGAIAMGHPGEGALYMLLFGLGTVPLMTSAIYFSSLLKGVAKQRLQRLIPIFVVAIGLLFILRGLGLGIPYISPKPVMEVAVGTMDCVP